MPDESNYTYNSTMADIENKWVEGCEYACKLMCGTLFAGVTNGQFTSSTRCSVQPKAFLNGCISSSALNQTEMCYSLRGTNYKQARYLPAICRSKSSSSSIALPVQLWVDIICVRPFHQRARLWSRLGVHTLRISCLQTRPGRVFVHLPVEPLI